jgi:hypothetical protein
VALVHGDPEALAALAARLEGLTEVILPADGMALPIAAGARGGQRVVAPPARALPDAVGQGAPLDSGGLERLWQLLSDGSGVQVFSLRELARMWYGAADLAVEAQAQAALDGEQLCFAPVAGAAGLWRLRTAVEMRRDAAAGLRGTGRQARPDQAAIQAIIDRRLGHAPDLYRRSVDAATGAVTLGFFFPDVAGARYADAIAAIEQEAGVPVALASEPHQGALAEAALAILPAGLSSTRAPSLKFALRSVQVRCEGAADAGALHDAERCFRERTGWQLEIITATTAQPAQPTVVRSDAAAPAHQSYALDTARELFPSYLGCYKISVDTPTATLTLRFHFPEIAAARYQDRLEQLAATTGWTVRIHPQAHQEELLRAARAALPADVELHGRPSLDQERRTLVARCQGAMTQEQIAAAQANFKEKTGWALILTGAAGSREA